MFDGAPMRCAELIESLDIPAKRKEEKLRTASVQAILIATWDVRERDIGYEDGRRPAPHLR
jgi:hypothetical protein